VSLWTHYKYSILCCGSASVVSGRVTRSVARHWRWWSLGTALCTRSRVQLWPTTLRQRPPNDDIGPLLAFTTSDYTAGHIANPRPYTTVKKSATGRIKQQQVLVRTVSHGWAISCFGCIQWDRIFKLYGMLHHLSQHIALSRQKRWTNVSACFFDLQCQLPISLIGIMFDAFSREAAI